MEIILDKKHFLTPSLFYLLKTYTKHDIMFEDGVKLDLSTIKNAFENTPVKNHLEVLFQHLDKGKLEDTDKIIEKSVEDLSAIKNVYYSLLFTDKKFAGMIKKEMKKKENKNTGICQFEEVHLDETLSQEFRKLMKPKETCRFPPEPSGYLHLGHVKAALLNNELCDNLIVRFDDTNQEKASDHFEKAILEDLELLHLKSFKLSRTSDFYQNIIELAVKLIRDGKAYCDDTDKETMNIERADGIESKCRNTDTIENIKIFYEMINNGKNDLNPGNEKFEKYCVRAKISIDNKNKALRDPVICRLKSNKHPRAMSRLSPTYDFACPIVDSLEGVTTVLRTNEFRDRNEQYFWFLDNLSLRKPIIKDFSRLNFENTCLSKRKLRGIIDEHSLSWDDPRVPTVKGIMRLGLHIDVLKDYIRLQGMKQANCITSWDKIWAMNKKYLDKICPRYSAIKENGNYDIIFINYNGETIEPYEKMIQWPLNKKIPDSPKKEVLTTKIKISKDDGDELEQGEEFTLMILGNCIVTEKKPGLIICKSNPEGNIKTTKRKVSWISSVDSQSYDLITYSDLLKNGEFNHESQSKEKILVEKACENINFGDLVQFERIAFVRKDKTLNSFIVVPNTTQKREK